MGFSKRAAGVVFGLSFSMVGAVGFGANARAEPGDMGDRHLVILDGAVKSCAGAGALCIKAGAPSTIKVGSAASAASGREVPVVPGFQRADKTAGGGDWTFDLSATLLRPAISGNTLFLIYDGEDPNAVRNHEVTVLYQATVRGGKTLNARLAVSPDDGVYPGHTYRIRVVQLVSGREVLLAEGDVALK